MERFDEIEDVSEMKEYLELHANEEMMHKYLNGGTIDKFAEYLIEQRTTA